MRRVAYVAGAGCVVYAALLGVSMSGGPVALHTLLPIPGVPARLPVAPTASAPNKATPPAKPGKTHRPTTIRPNSASGGPVLVSVKTTPPTKPATHPVTHPPTTTPTPKPSTTHSTPPSTNPPTTSLPGVPHA